MIKDLSEINGKVFLVIVVEQPAADPGSPQMWQIVGTSRWRGGVLSVEGVDYGVPFEIPSELHELVCPIEEFEPYESGQTAEYGIIIPSTAYPGPLGVGDRRSRGRPSSRLQRPAARVGRSERVVMKRGANTAAAEPPARWAAPRGVPGRASEKGLW
jgi:hypothetical protein